MIKELVHNVVSNLIISATYGTCTPACIRCSARGKGNVEVGMCTPATDRYMLLCWMCVYVTTDHTQKHIISRAKFLK